MKRIARSFVRPFLLASVIGFTAPAALASGDGCNTTTNLSVLCSRSSSLVQINLTGCHKIGRVVMEIKDQQGRTLYREEGKAMTGELVRRLDKGVFPRGTHVITVVAKDFAVTQRFTIE